ncbi:glycoside hydrolase family 13 protein [Nonomuraea sp. NPDC050404]|uniref:glycoside hydrolase family 13 protein n=1 Tax=Nonomuraea sp. NPDC050404 TaxID=3155783 RepID=UPI00340B3A2B
MPSRAFNLGETVPVRVRIPLGSPYERVVLRSMTDGEVRTVPAVLTDKSDQDEWYEAPLLLHNPVTRYRFMLITGDETFDWLNGTGVWSYDVSDAFDFTITTYGAAPDWARESVVYEIFPDRFARSAEADHREVPDWAVPTPWDQTPEAGRDSVYELYGGDLAGIEDNLGYLADLGVRALYLTPIFPARSAHRYDASTFDEIDPLLGGDQAFTSLTTAAHERGMRIVGDLTTNHTGDSHEWFVQAGSSTSPADFYLWHAPGDHVSWQGVSSLPKLNWSSPGLRERFIDGPGSVVGRWLQSPYNLDGWRIDVANMTGRYRDQDLAHEVARTIRATIASIRPDGVLVAEHMHDASEDLRGDGWQSAMNYAGFTRPVWNWLAAPGNTLNYLDLPIAIPRRGGREIARTIREISARLPWQVAANQWNNLGSHDTPRLLTILGADEHLMEIAAGLLMTYLGVPMIFAGDEWGATGTNGEHGRRTMPWNDLTTSDHPLRRRYRDLIHLRNEHRALQHGGLRWVFQEDDALAYLRETREETILVLASRAPWAGAQLPPLRGLEEAQLIYGTTDLIGHGTTWRLPPDGPNFAVWKLPT